MMLSVSHQTGQRWKHPWRLLFITLNCSPRDFKSLPELPTLLLRLQRENLEFILFLMDHPGLTGARSRLLASFTLLSRTILARTTCWQILWPLLELWMSCLERSTDKQDEDFL